MSSKTVIKKAGCFFCHHNCGVLVHVQDGKIVKVTGNPDHPGSRGHICARAANAPKWLNHPDQLKHALKRVGERGAGKWEQIPWEQALDEIAEKLAVIKEKYGPESLIVAEGTYRSDLFWARARFLDLFGNPHNIITPGMVCFCNVYTLDLALAGAMIMPDIPRSKCVVLWGANPKEARPIQWKVLKKKKDAGAMKIITVDPRITDSGKLADINLQIRPGTDCALALGWINVIINEKLYDKSFVDKWTYGFSKLTDRIEEYSPRRVAEVTGLTAEQIIESARLYATSDSSCINRGVATDQLGLNSGRVEQARVILAAITGNIDIPGGDQISNPPTEFNGKKFICESELELPEKCLPETRKKMIGSERFKIMSWPAWEIVAPLYEKNLGISCPQLHYLQAPTPLAMRQIITEDPYPIKALITWASNPLMWAANTKQVLESLTHPNLDLHVVLEYWMTPTAQLADYVLPAASWLERPLCTTTENWLPVAIGGERSIEPMGDRHDDYQFWRELGIRLGQKEYWPWETIEEVIKYRLSHLETSYEEFVEKGMLYPEKKVHRKYEQTGFATPTGKLELSSTIFEKLGYDPLPHYEEPPESPLRTPEIYKEYPLILNTGGRFMPQFHSEHRQLGIGLREKHPDPLVTIHPETAAKYNIKEGDWVWIETPRGKIKQKAFLTVDILPDVINAEASWWFPEKAEGLPNLSGALESNANVLTIDDPDMLDPLTGGWPSRALLCRISKE